MIRTILLLVAGVAVEGIAAPPDLPPEFFARNRAAYMERMNGGIAVFVAPPEIPRNDDATYPYRQDSDFFYLTGFPEPGAVAVLRPDAPEGERYILFVRPRDPLRETWDGLRHGVRGAVEKFGADRAYVIDSLATVLPRYLAEVDRAYLDRSEDHPWAHTAVDSITGSWQSKLSEEKRRLLNADEISNELRVIKSSEEIEILQQAVDITADAHRAAMAAMRPGMNEYEIEALIEYVFRTNGSPRVGFNSIVGSGPNTRILHYIENDRQTQDGDLVLIDIGAEWEYYTADVTRTVPVNGRFTPEQRAIYQIVLDAQQAAMDLVRPGATIKEIRDITIPVIVEGLIRVGLLSGTVEENLESREYRRFYMHGSSHWLGLDVHDVGSYMETSEDESQEPRVLVPGMVFTIEPGVYIAEGMEGVDPKWWNTGVRIEDDVLVTETGYRNMSASAPRAIDEIEALMEGRGPPQVVP